MFERPRRWTGPFCFMHLTQPQGKLDLPVATSVSVSDPYSILKMKLSGRKFVEAVGCWVLFASNVAAQAAVPLGTLAKPDATTTQPFGAIESVRALNKGDVLVNDPKKRQLVVLDSTFTPQRLVMDSASENGKPYYSSRQNSLSPYLADSTLYLDTRQEKLLVIDPNGVIVHPFDKPMSGPALLTMFPPRGFDAAGNAYTTSVPRVNFPGTNMIGGGVDRQIMRAVFSAQKYEELARLHTSFNGGSRSALNGKGEPYTRAIVNPMAPVDEWTVLSDGTVVVLRAKDYSVEMINAGNKQRLSRKIPYEKRRVSDIEKRRLIDSALAVPDANAAGRDRSTNTSASTNDMEDFYPPFRQGQPVVDLDANVWIATYALSPVDTRETMYDVVNNQALLVRRVRVPAGRIIVGFGRNGVVYVKYKTDTGAWMLERTHLAQ